MAKSRSEGGSGELALITLFIEPFLNVGPSIPDVATEFEADWANAPVTPRIDRPLWDAEVFGKILQGHKQVGMIHQL